jgi:hypothetical protein
MSTLLFYQQVVTLDRELHAKLKLRPLGNMGFAAGSPVVPLLCAEFAQAAREYPIAFLRNADQSLVPVVLTGVPGGGNLYIDAADQWNAHYVPAYARRYPFVFAETAPDQLTVCFDQACPALNNTDGAALFDDNGEPSTTLQQVLQLLREYQSQALLSQSFMQRLDAADLLMDTSAQADLGDGRSLALQGFLVVDEARFKALPEATLKDWFASGELGLIYAHLFSLGNLLELLRRLPQPQVAAPSKTKSRKQRVKS